MSSDPSGAAAFGSTTTPLQQFKARLKPKSGATRSSPSSLVVGSSGDKGAERWKRKYDLAVKHPLAKHLSATQTADSRNESAAHEILSPSSGEDGDEAGPNDLQSASSADDSIIRRVEEEIAAARKAASGVNRLQSPRDTDMAKILQIEDSDDKRDPNVSNASSSAAVTLMQDEFQPHQENQTLGQQQQQRDGVEKGYAPSSPPPPPVHTEEKKAEQMYFSADWQAKDTPADENIPTTEESEPPSSPEVPSPPQRDIMVEPTNERKIDGKNTYVFRLVRNVRPSEAPADERDALASKSVDQQQDPNESAEVHQSSLPPVTQGSPKSPKSAIQSSPKSPKAPTSPPLPVASPSSGSSIAAAKTQEPEGNYSRNPDHTLRSVKPATPSKQDDQGNVRLDLTPSPDDDEQIPRINSLATTQSKRDMDRQRTRELLGSLKEQTTVISTVNAATPTRRLHETPSSRKQVDTPRSPNHFTFSRANRARERVKTASKAGGRSPRSMDPRKSPRSAPRNAPRASSRSHRTPNFPDHADLPKRSSKMEEDPKISRRIRFRNPFPVLKPPGPSRSADLIVQDHQTGVPETPIRWVKPKRELKQLIVAAMGTSLPRRSNACGALKVLTRQRKNQLALVRTDGFLSALIFAASQNLVEADRELALVARTRAVNCLKHVSEPKDNRVLMTNHPGVLECLVKVMTADGGEGRVLATAALAMLAKTACCREGLARVDGLVDAAAKVMNGATSFITEETEPLNDENDEEEEPTRTYTESASDFSHSASTGTTTMREVSKSDELEEQDEEVTAVSESSMSEDEDEGATINEEQPVVEPTTSWQKAAPKTDSIRYKAEERQQEFTDQARANACAVLLHLSKQCVISVRTNKLLYLLLFPN